MEDEAPVARESNVTTMVVHDVHDVSPPPLMLRRAPSDPFVTVEDAGHAVLLEKPDFFNQCLCEFLESVEPSQG